MLVLSWSAFAQSPEQQAISYLEGEVGSWSGENGCYSCHNDGDGARALYAATAAGYSVRAAALADTTGWLGEPSRWNENRGDPGFSDKALARVQWAAALAADPRASEEALAEAAQLVAQDQNDDGSWGDDAGGAVGSPTTWGRALTTVLAVRVLRSADRDDYAHQIAEAETWLGGLDPLNTPDATALVFAFGDAAPANKGRRFLKDAQASDGGWGPYRNAPSEVFDTALAVLALKDGALVAQGRAYLLRTQLAAGGWPETTRPSGSQSYAQHVSTTAWALMALVGTDVERD